MSQFRRVKEGYPTRRDLLYAIAASLLVAGAYAPVLFHGSLLYYVGIASVFPVVCTVFWIFSSIEYNTHNGTASGRRIESEDS